MMPTILPEQLAEIQSFEDLARFCHEVLGWPSAQWRTFEGVPELYGIQPEEIPGVQRLAAVQPLDGNQSWGIFEVDFGETTMRRSALRRVLNKVAERARQHHANPTWLQNRILFIVRDAPQPGKQRWTFAYYRGERLADARLRAFGWSGTEFTRTVRERNLPHLAWEKHGDEWERAWDVEGLTRNFFTDYKRVFDQVEGMVQGLEEPRTGGASHKCFSTASCSSASSSRRGGSSTPPAPQTTERVISSNCTTPSSRQTTEPPRSGRQPGGAGDAAGTGKDPGNAEQRRAADGTVRNRGEVADAPEAIPPVPQTLNPAPETLNPAPRTPIFTQVKSLDPPYPDVKALIQQGGFSLPAEAIQGSNWTLADRETIERLRKMESAGIPLGEYVKGKIYYGIKTGFNRAFVIDGKKRAELIAEDPKSAEIIKPLAVGDDVRRWHIRNRDRWLIFTRRGIDIEKYPAIEKHLAQWKAQLTPKPTTREGTGRAPGDYRWYELQASPAEDDRFERPKVVYQEIATYPRFALLEAGWYANNKVFLIPGGSHFLLGVLNSGVVWTYLRSTAGALQGGALQMQKPVVSRVPIPRASGADHLAIESLVQQILDAKAADPDAEVSALEAEIDAIVERLYFGGKDR